MTLISDHRCRFGMSMFQRLVNGRAISLFLLSWVVFGAACIDLNPSWKQELLYAGGQTGGDTTRRGGTTIGNEDTLNSTGGVGGSQPLFGGSSGGTVIQIDASKDVVSSGGGTIDGPMNKGGSESLGGSTTSAGGAMSGGIPRTGGNTGGISTGGMAIGGVTTGGIATGGSAAGGALDASLDIVPDLPNTGGSYWPSGWSVQNISNDEDVSLAGTLVRAVKLDGSSEMTIHGVTFKNYQLPSSPYTLPNGDVITPSDTNRMSSYDGYGVRSDAYARLSTAYQALLQRGFYNDGSASTASTTARFTLDLKGLTAGKTYLLQIWVNDSRASNLNQSNALLYVTLSDGSESIALHQNKSGQAGGTGQYAIVVFDATGSSKTFTLTGGNESTASTALATSIMMAYQVRQK